MTSNVVWGIDFRAKRRLPNPLEELAVQIMGEITVYGFDWTAPVEIDAIAMRHEPDTAPCECLPSGPWTDGAA
jgi:hypothetical protein